jgi:sulfatase modifying factor 1
MKTRTLIPVVAVLFTALALAISSPAQASTITDPGVIIEFGSGTNTFDINFVNIGNAGNAADATGYGAVPYEYRMGIYEISQDNIDKATASGLANVTAGAWSGNQPAANISWYEAAAFVNWLNTSTGKQAAYDLTFSGGSWSMTLWSSTDAWQLGGENLYRHKDAYYFLPSENEWYKAAYYNAAGLDYFFYPTGSDTAPTPVASGTDAGTAVYGSVTNAPAGVEVAGGLSAYGTMGQGGNVWEWSETASDGINSSPSEARVFRGGDWSGSQNTLDPSLRGGLDPSIEDFLGFRVASVPEPSTYALLAMTAAAALWLARRRR